VPHQPLKPIRQAITPPFCRGVGDFEEPFTQPASAEQVSLTAWELEEYRLIISRGNFHSQEEPEGLPLLGRAFSEQWGLIASTRSARLFRSRSHMGESVRHAQAGILNERRHAELRSSEVIIVDRQQLHFPGVLPHP